jgi:hypothetical protein
VEEHHYGNMATANKVAVEQEIEKTIDQVHSFDSIIESIEKRRYRIHHVDDFSQIITYCKALLEEKLEKRLRSAVGSLADSNEQIKELDKFRDMIRKLAERLNDIAVNSFDIPHELYFLCDDFMECYASKKPHYIISISDEVALTPFSFLLQSIGKFEEEYFFKEFWSAISKQRFYIVQIVSGLSERTSALDWPVILHEIAHMICSENEIDSKYFPGISIYDALITMKTLQEKKLTPTSPGVKLAAKKLHASEFLADYLATRCYGPTFGWRFARKWVDLKSVFERSHALGTHPEPSRRLDKIINEVKTSLKMPLVADFLGKEAATLQGRSQTPGQEIKPIDIGDDIIKDVEEALAKVKNGINKRSKFILTKEVIEKCISRSMWFRLTREHQGTREKLTSFDLRKIREGISKGKPIVVDPSVVYYLIVLNSMASSKELKRIEAKDESARMFREFVADMIRQYHIQKQFLHLKQAKRGLIRDMAQLEKIHVE